MNGNAVLIVWGAAACAMLVGWLLQRATRNAGIADAIWAACLSGGALYYAGVGTGSALSRGLVAVFGGFWGFRLSMHLLTRVLTEEEDGRYRQLRAHWHGSEVRFFALFQVQAALVALFSLPFLAVAENPVTRISAWHVIGVTVWLVSLAGESFADLELARFRRDPRNSGRTCRIGLWRYSRHPNYFFEWLHWFAYVALAVGSPIAWTAWLGPLLMYIALRWVSGVPFVEAQALRSRGDDYRAYQSETSAFIPWVPKPERTSDLRKA
ncbi:DUF1295 domain-containing protein [Tahibacter amnicola]|uniref:DUF1295 domain-containing protein n=1 Tax=Tahibacter amnicola TaxID=2976241 RepID=A0ABY6BB88_9GAMM|nr:DUF1295 domain-containing protein [Tahibacter amnicola]UXI67326.1 DUF1295 domain-containing protein [Tahibacter amnicola]